MEPETRLPTPAAAVSGGFSTRFKCQVCQGTWRDGFTHESRAKCPYCEKLAVFPAVAIPVAEAAR